MASPGGAGRQKLKKISPRLMVVRLWGTFGAVVIKRTIGVREQLMLII
ncbi:hypothetical protein MNBD_GAMMA21-2034 [hydrothermal vent metagenome]|uniref:Uncharacterized protein n=1 Tax=hydrothermal vent metagenome TaxID=652676 RepID=A0A3B1AN00_9ZZZZ